MNRKFRRAARILYRENFGFIFLCSLLVFGLLPLTDLLVQTIPFLSNPSMRILARLIASVLSAPLFAAISPRFCTCGKPENTSGPCSFISLPRRALGEGGMYWLSALRPAITSFKCLCISGRDSFGDSLSARHSACFE